MESMKGRQGGCQCGSVRYQLEAEPLTLAMCFCSDCQQQSGSAFGMSLVVPRESLRILKGETASFEGRADSGASKGCHFCPQCGTRLFHLPGALPANLNLKPGTLDDTSGLAPKLAVWTIRKPAWLALPEGVRSFERNPG